MKLTERTIDVHVVFLDGFVSIGWAGYATCGRSHTGGWATSSALYALKSSYDTNSEDFRVSYLAHEGRHFADYQKPILILRGSRDYQVTDEDVVAWRNGLAEASGVEIGGVHRVDQVAVEAGNCFV